MRNGRPDGGPATSPDPKRAGRCGQAFGAKQIDKSGEILILCADCIVEPRTEARATETAYAGRQLQLRRPVIELIAVHGLDEGQIIDNLGQMRHELGNIRTGLAVLLEFIRRPEKSRM